MQKRLQHIKADAYHVRLLQPLDDAAENVALRALGHGVLHRDGALCSAPATVQCVPTPCIARHRLIPTCIAGWLAATNRSSTGCFVAPFGSTAPLSLTSCTPSARQVSNPCPISAHQHCTRRSQSLWWGADLLPADFGAGVGVEGDVDLAEGPQVPGREVGLLPRSPRRGRLLGRRLGRLRRRREGGLHRRRLRGRQQLGHHPALGGGRHRGGSWLPYRPPRRGRGGPAIRRPGLGGVRGRARAPLGPRTRAGAGAGAGAAGCGGWRGAMRVGAVRGERGEHS